MKVVDTLAAIEPAAPSIVTIGNFDGVHRGHQAIFETVRREATGRAARAVAVTFDPHPLVVIAPDRAPPRILAPTDKRRLIEAGGIDVLLIQKFDAAFRATSPESFIENFLIAGLNARCVCVGQNFRFGQGHAGTIETLGAWRQAFEVIEVPPVMDGASAVSSSRVREYLASGRLTRVRHMLGRCFEIAGPMVPGAGRGRRIGVPTLNLHEPDTLIPARGVYVTRVSIDDGPLLGSVTNIGTRPTFDASGGTGRTSIETHVLDTTLPEGGATVRIRFLRRLRDERRFSSADLLLKQIADDMTRARRYFRRSAGSPSEFLCPPVSGRSGR